MPPVPKRPQAIRIAEEERAAQRMSRYGKPQQCPLCRKWFVNEVSPDGKLKRGRPRVFCSEACQKFPGTLILLTKQLREIVNAGIDPDQWAAIRKDLGGLATMNASFQRHLGMKGIEAQKRKREAAKAAEEAARVSIVRANSRRKKPW